MESIRRVTVYVPSSNCKDMPGSSYVFFSSYFQHTTKTLCENAKGFCNKELVIVRNSYLGSSYFLVLTEYDPVIRHFFAANPLEFTKQLWHGQRTLALFADIQNYAAFIHHD
ncbi:hypothetical protein D3C74_343210 [compost metagenome]